LQAVNAVLLTVSFCEINTLLLNSHDVIGGIKKLVFKWYAHDTSHNEIFLLVGKKNSNR